MPRPKGARGPDYSQKRALLLRRMSARLGRLNDTRPSLRQLAEAAEVTVPTLRHYFGARDDIIEAVLQEYRQMGEPFLRQAREPQGPFAESVEAFVQALVRGMERGRLGDLFAVVFVEGLLNERLGPSALAHVVDPAVDALAARLAAHQARGDMKPVNPRHAALMLIAPLLLAWHHQNQMFGHASRELDVQAFLKDLVEAFVTAHRA